MRVPPKPPAEPGEWQEEENQYGGVRRYRMNGGIKEYEMMVRIDGIEIPQSELTAYHERKKAAEQARKEAEKNAPPTPPRKNCPLFDNTGINNTECNREKCALYMDGCTLARLTPAKDTEGLQCPFDRYNRGCRKDCALYRNGCTLTGIKESEDK